MPHQINTSHMNTIQYLYTDITKHPYYQKLEEDKKNLNELLEQIYSAK